MNNFDLRLRNIPSEWKGVVIPIVDTMDTIKVYLNQEDIKYTAADLIAATALVLEQKARNETE